MRGGRRGHTWDADESLERGETEAIEREFLYHILEGVNEVLGCGEGMI